MIRRATVADADAIGAVFLATRDLMTYLPPIPDQDRPHLGGWIVEREEVWVAEDEGQLIGFCSVLEDELARLYVAPDQQSRGVGTALLDRAKRLRPGGLELWVFQRNEGVRRLYERCGFRLVRLTNGADNMEESRTRSTNGGRPSRPRVTAAGGRGWSGRSRGAGSRSYPRRSP